MAPPSNAQVSPAPKLRWANPLAFAVLAIFFAVETTSRLVRTRQFDEESLGDFLINLSFTWRTLENAAFPPDFYYPLPFIVFYDALGALGVPAGALVWFALMICGALASCAVLIRLAGWGGHPLRWPAAALAVLSAIYFAQWDLRTGNSNFVYLALLLGALAQTRSWRAGALLALSVSLKLYSVLLLPYLAWTRRWDWLGWSLVWLFVCFVVVPGLVMGPAFAFDLTLLWLEKLLAIPDAAALPDFYKSLTASLLALLTDVKGEGENIAALSPSLVRGLAAGWQLAWLAVIGLYFARAQSLRGPDAPRELLLLDVSAIALLPLPFSPTFQAHHAVVTLVPAFLLVAIGIDGDAPLRRRAIAAGFLVAAAVVVKIVSDWPARGVAIMLSLAISAGALVWMAEGLRSRKEPGPSRRSTDWASADASPR